MRLLYSQTLANKTLTFYLPKGQWGNIIVEYIGTTDTGQTGQRSDMGSVILNWNGEDIVNVDAEILNLLANLYGGVAEATFATAGLNRMIAILTPGVWYDSQNIFDVADTDKVYIKLDFTTFANKCATSGGSVNIYSKPKVGVMNYFHKIISRNINVSSAVTVADTFPISNVSQLYLKNLASRNISNIQINKDDENIIDCSPKLLNAYSDWIHLLETTNGTVAVDFGESKDIREVIGTQISYKYTFTAADTLEQYFSYVEFTPEKASQSRLTAQNKILKNINKRIQ